MDYDMKSPCGTCPFRREGGIKLMPGRIREIANMMLDPRGGEFPCHETVDYSEEPDDDAGRRISGDGEIHCAGALIFAEKNGNATQMMRIMERTGGYDHAQFADEARAAVWDTKAEWLKGGKVARAKK